MSKEEIRVLHDGVLIEPTEDEGSASILIPDSAKKKPTEGKVIAVGMGARDSNGKYLSLEVKVGDTVMYRKWTGTEIKFNGKDCMILKESEILAIIKGGK